MAVWQAGRLSDAQARLVERWLPQPQLVTDLSWDLVDTTVLHVRTGDAEIVIKAAGASNHHIGREITAHESFTAPLVECGGAARMIRASREVNILLTEYLQGVLVEGTDAEYLTSSYEQAGCLLRALHSGSARTDHESERQATDKALAWLDSNHRITPEAERDARRILNEYRPMPVTVVPTHGDWQPRNWLVDTGRIKVIDFGRFAFRPAESDLCRLAAQQWRFDDALEAAFFEGYGSDPRDEVRWPIMMLREAIGTAAWAFQVNDHRFEAQGLRMIDEALARF